MTDVPLTFFFLCAICAWVQAERSPGWLLAAGAFTAMALMTRGLMGFALPAIFATHAWLTRRKLPSSYAAAALALALLPLGACCAYTIRMHGQFFFDVHAAWLDRQVCGALSPAWRRYTGAPEYLWLLAQSYWPWLPVMLVGLAAAVRDRRLSLLWLWTAAVFVLCSVTRSRVLRYMLPAYPAFAMLSAIGIMRLFGEARTRRSMRYLLPVLGVGVLVVALFPRRAGMPRSSGPSRPRRHRRRHRASA